MEAEDATPLEAATKQRSEKRDWKHQSVCDSSSVVTSCVFKSWINPITDPNPVYRHFIGQTQRWTVPILLYSYEYIRMLAAYLILVSCLACPSTLNMLRSVGWLSTNGIMSQKIKLFEITKLFEELCFRIFRTFQELPTSISCTEPNLTPYSLHVFSPF
jgi:hypothetical protein